MELIDKFLETQPSETSNFWTSSYAFSNVKIVCGNEFSVNWLKVAWAGAELTAITMSENLKRKPAPKAQIKFFVPNGIKKKSYESICKHIELRNPPIKTEKWDKWKEESVPKGFFYHVIADEESVKEIQKKGGRLFYSLQ